MRISDLLKMGLRNLTRRKARTALTVIGMVIGTISIVVMISIGIGMNQSFQEQIMENGSMTIIQIHKNAWYEDKEGNYQSKEQKMNDSTIEQLKEIEHVRAVSPVIETYTQFKSGKYTMGTSLIGIDTSTLKDFGFPDVSEGQFPTAENPRVLLIGDQVLQRQFYYWTRYSSKMKEIKWGKDKITFTFNEYQVDDKKKPFEVRVRDYGVLAGNTDGNSQYSYNIYIDLEYYRELFTNYAKTLKTEDRKRAMKSLNEYNSIQINVDNMKYVTQVQDKIKELGFHSESMMQYIQSNLDTANMLQMVLGAIGAVAMLVSAINIANTMIMSIYERTKEIGVMKVLGCLIKDIKKLFLFEAGMIGLLGGVIGIALSYAASYFINKYGSTLLGSLMSYGEGGGDVSRIPFWLPLAAAVGTIIVGVISGYIPARRATKISAIEAMKSDG